MKANTISSRRAGLSSPSSACLSATLIDRLEATASASTDGSSISPSWIAGFGRQPLVELGVILELVDHRAHQRLGFGALGGSPRRRPRPRPPCSRRAAPDRPAGPGAGPRPAPARCRRAASAAASRWRPRRGRRARRGRDRPRPDRAGRRGTIPCRSAIAASSAATDFSRPTNSGTMRCGKTTMSRSGRIGKQSCHARLYGRRSGAAQQSRPEQSPAIARFWRIGQRGEVRGRSERPSERDDLLHDAGRRINH